MYKIAVMGDLDSIYGFAALGLDTYPVPVKEAADTLKKLVAANYAVIYITEAYAAQLSELLGEYMKQSLPAIIPIPGITGNTGAGMENVSKLVEQAVGSDILKD